MQKGNNIMSIRKIKTNYNRRFLSSTWQEKLAAREQIKEAKYTEIPHNNQKVQARNGEIHEPHVVFSKEYTRKSDEEVTKMNEIQKKLFILQHPTVFAFT